MSLPRMESECVPRSVLNGNGHGNGYAEKSDAELVLLCRKHDERAFEVIVKRHQRVVYGLLYRLLPGWHDKADLAQEACIRIWRRIGELRNPFAFHSWLRQIVVNLFYDELKKQSRRINALSIDETIDRDGRRTSDTRDIPDKDPEPDELYEDQELL